MMVVNHHHHHDKSSEYHNQVNQDVYLIMDKSFKIEEVRSKGFYYNMSFECDNNA